MTHKDIVLPYVIATLPLTEMMRYHDIVNELAERSAIGEETYGTKLTTNNGRNSLRDLQEELLDSLMYVRQAILEGRLDSFPQAQAGIPRQLALIADFIRCVDEQP